MGNVSSSFQFHQRVLANVTLSFHFYQAAAATGDSCQQGSVSCDKTTRVSLGKRFLAVIHDTSAREERQVHE